MRRIQGFLAFPLFWLVAAGGPVWAESSSPTEEPSTERAKPAAEVATRRPAALRESDVALHRYAQLGDIDRLEAALAAKTPVDSRDRFGMTALIYAVKQGHVMVVKRLIEAGADPDLRAPNGATALLIAAEQRATYIIEVLMQAGADTGIRGGIEGWTPVQAARASYGSHEDARVDNPAVLALLKGKALREVEEERNRRFWRNWPVGKGFKDFEGGPSMLVVKGMRGEDVYRFAVSRRKITVAQYNQCVEEGGCKAVPSLSGDGDSIREESSEDNGERVADVSWEARQRYARWMRQKTGHAYRTMAQDEFSGRGLPEPTNPFGLRLLAVPEGFSPERSWQQRWKRYSAAKASGYGTGLWNPWLDYLEPADPALRLKGLSEALERFVEESRGFWVARPLAP